MANLIYALMIGCIFICQDISIDGVENIRSLVFIIITLELFRYKKNEH